MFGLFKKITRVFGGLNLGRIPGARAFYNALFSWLKPKGIVEIDTVVGRLWVDTKDTGEVPYLLLKGVYDEYETSIIKNLIRPGMVAIDIGAHIGYFTVLMARASGPNGKIYAFEPEVSNRELLERNLKLNNLANVEVSKLALSNSKGTKKLYTDKKNLGNPSFSQENIPEENLDRVSEVGTITLDEYMGEVRSDFVKIDVQGAEGLVFEGAQKVLSRNSKILMEFWPFGLKNVGTDPLALLKNLESMGYSFKIIDGGKRILKPKTALELLNVSGNRENGRGWANVLCER